MVQLAEICGSAGDEQSLKFYNYYNQLTKPTYILNKKSHKVETQQLTFIFVLKRMCLYACALHKTALIKMITGSYSMYLSTGFWQDF